MALEDVEVGWAVDDPWIFAVRSIRRVGIGRRGISSRLSPGRYNARRHNDRSTSQTSPIRGM